MFEYYGLDWIDAIYTILGIYFLSTKNKLGFILNAVGAISGFILFIILNSYPFMVLNIILVGLNLYGYLKWKNS